MFLWRPICEGAVFRDMEKSKSEDYQLWVVKCTCDLNLVQLCCMLEAREF